MAVFGLVISGNRERQGTALSMTCPVKGSGDVPNRDKTSGTISPPRDLGLNVQNQNSQGTE